jgi:phage terminase small subunit
MKGRPPKPATLRAIEGGRRHKKRPAVPPPTAPVGIPDPPADLPADAREMWPIVAAIVGKVCTLADGEALALLAEARAYLRRTRALLEKMPADRQTQIAYETAQRIYASRLADFGQTPTSRQKVASVEGPAQSRFAKFKA